MREWCRKVLFADSTNRLSVDIISFEFSNGFAESRDSGSGDGLKISNEIYTFHFGKELKILKVCK